MAMPSPLPPQACSGYEAKAISIRTSSGGAKAASTPSADPARDEWGFQSVASTILPSRVTGRVAISRRPIIQPVRIPPRTGGRFLQASAVQDEVRRAQLLGVDIVEHDRIPGGLDHGVALNELHVDVIESVRAPGTVAVVLEGDHVLGRIEVGNRRVDARYTEHERVGAAQPGQGRIALCRH